MIDITRSCGIFVFAGQHQYAMSKMAIGYKPAIDQEEDSPSDQEYQQGGTPCVVGKIYKKLFQKLQKSVLDIEWLVIRRQYIKPVILLRDFRLLIYMPPTPKKCDIPL